MPEISRVIYKAPQEQFYDDSDNNRIGRIMCEQAYKKKLVPSEPEITSWVNNAPRIATLLRKSGVTGVYVTFEYLIPYRMNRIDCMLYGKSLAERENVVHIELKQWDNRSVTSAFSSGNFEVDDNNDHTLNDSAITEYKVHAHTGGANRTVAHPSQQVKGYNDYLTGFIEVLGNNQMDIEGVAYCYNYNKNEKPDVLFSEQYAPIIEQYRTFAGNEVNELSELLHSVLGKGDGLSVFNKMANSPIRPSKKVLDSMSKIFADKENKEFSLIEDQIVARNLILDRINNFNGTKKNVIVVKGGPGTGKTVIALHILAILAGDKKQRHNIRFATKSKPLLEGIKNQLPKDSKAKLLFSNLSQMLPANCEKNSIDVLIIDEAHRIVNNPNNQYMPKEMRTDKNQIQTLIDASEISIFFIDDKQAIRSREIGSSEMIEKCAEENGADIFEVQLKSQFRCNGSNNYLDWIEQVLYDKKITSSFTKEEYDFQIFDSPSKLYETIKNKNNNGITSRLTAGFCWKWSDTLGDDGDLIKDVTIGDFAMPWETKDSVRNVPKGYVKWFEWAYKPEGIKQVGCIYTAQGFEFDYIGVIIGPDLRYNKESKSLITDRNETKDPTLKRGKENFDTYVRNIYRVLMSRGMKGCYVYCCDKNLSDHLRSLLSKM